MKKISGVAVLALVLVFGLASVGCGGPDESPQLTEIYVVTRADMDAGNYYNYASTIGASEGFFIRYVGRNLYEDIVRIVITVKRGATVVNFWDWPFTNPIPKGGNFLTNAGIFKIGSAGSYTIEVYVVDAKGNKSNTRTVTLTVTQ